MSSSHAKRDVCVSSQQAQRGDPHFVIASAAWRSSLRHRERSVAIHDGHGHAGLAVTVVFDL
jgi:hypothetical protein